MKLQPDRADGVNLIRSHEPGRVLINQDAYAQSVIVPPTGDVLRWDCQCLDDLSLADFERIAALRPEVVIFGSGTRLRFPPPALLKPLMAARIGIETMDTAAACRTYNILVSEGRQAVAALLIGDASST